MADSRPENEIRKKLMCDNCPAIELRTFDEIDRIEFRAGLMEIELTAMGKPELFILCESFPDRDYIYDLKKPAFGGLRISLKNELYGDIEEADLIKKLRDDKIIVIHCAYCPLHSLGQAGIIDIRHATTICMKRHNLDIFKKYSDTPVITIFPHRRGFNTVELPEIAKRVTASFPFNNLEGLKDKVKEVLGKK